MATRDPERKSIVRVSYYSMKEAAAASAFVFCFCADPHAMHTLCGRGIEVQGHGNAPLLLPRNPFHTSQDLKMDRARRRRRLHPSSGITNGAETVLASCGRANADRLETERQSFASISKTKKRGQLFIRVGVCGVNIMEVSPSPFSEQDDVISFEIPRAPSPPSPMGSQKNHFRR